MLPRLRPFFVASVRARPFTTTVPALNINRAADKLVEKLEKLTREYEDYNGINNNASEQDVRGTNLVRYNDTLHRRADLERLRVVPRDRAFYMSNPPHEEVMRTLTDMLQKNINLPLEPVESYKRPTWISYGDYSVMAGGTRLRPSDYRAFVRLVSRLDAIDSQLIPQDIVDVLDSFKRNKEVVAQKSAYKQLDSHGRASAVGRRKSSSARVIVVRGKENIRGQFLVNGKPLDVYFPRLQDRSTAVFPLKVVEAMSYYNVFATVQGGGLTGQCGAISQGLAKALVIQNPLLGKRLSKAGCTKRDVRHKERKKPGKPKARKSNTWVKR